MRIAVVSDFHFGYGYNTELEDDSFDNAEEAMEQAVKCDIILNAGDIFDTKYPKTPVWARGLRILVKPLTSESPSTRFVSSTNPLKPISQRVIDHIPTVALHGNHELRGQTTNTLEALENAGLLIHIHCGTVVFEKDGVRMAVHGMSWVPDRYARKVLEEWDPKPLPDCFNILMFHQSISPFLYSPLEKPGLDISDMPEGFDLIINGHLHNAGSESVGGVPFIMPGSTVITQFNKGEAKGEKGFYEIDLSYDDSGQKNIHFSFKPIEGRRRFFFEDVSTSGSLKENVENKLEEILSRRFEKSPLIKLKIKGNDSEYIEQDIKEIERNYREKVILRFVKDLQSPEIAERVEFLRNLREQKLSSEEIGLNLLHKNLGETNFGSSFEVENIFNLLVEGRVDNAFDIIVGAQKTLGDIEPKPNPFDKFTKVAE